jgi:ABC-type spermidine/putrescine transport system permease subunit II
MNYKKNAKKIDVPGILLGLATILVLGFILTPIWITIIVSFNAGDFIVFPPTGFSLKWYKRFATDYMWILAFKNSLLIAIPTMPVQIWGSLRYEVTPIVAAVSTVMICTTLIGIAIGSRFIGIQKISEM